jgi:hypothetical protein
LIHLVKKNKKLDKTINTTVFTTWIDEFGICRTKVKPNAVIMLDDARENSLAVIKLSGGKTPPLLVDLREITSIDKSARDHFAMRNRKPGICAIAMLIKSPLSKVIGNFFLGINMPSVPTQLFTSEEKAILWLKKYIANK